MVDSLLPASSIVQMSRVTASVCMRRCWVCACVCFCRYVAASIIVFGFWTIGLCVYVFFFARVRSRDLFAVWMDCWIDC